MTAYQYSHMSGTQVADVMTKNLRPLGTGLASCRTKVYLYKYILIGNIFGGSIMELYEAMKSRRTTYMLKPESPISDEHIEQIVGDCLKYTPSAFHSETARVIALFGENHAKLWSIVMETLRAHVAPEKFGPTEAKVNGFAAGYATLLFYEDQDPVKALQAQFPRYADNFPLWSLQSSGMVQYAIWTALESEGFGVNIQHYNPIIDEEVARTFDVPDSWNLITQMIMGTPTAQPGPLMYKPIADRLVVKR